MDDILVYRAGFLDLKTMKSPTRIVTSINIDNHFGIVYVSVVKGLSVDSFKMTMEHAQDIGFINIQALNKIFR